MTLPRTREFTTMELLDDNLKELRIYLLIRGVEGILKRRISMYILRELICRDETGVVRTEGMAGRPRGGNSSSCKRGILRQRHGASQWRSPNLLLLTVVA